MLAALRVLHVDAVARVGGRAVSGGNHNCRQVLRADWGFRGPGPRSQDSRVARAGAACSAYPTVVEAPGPHRAYECRARRARTVGRRGDDRRRYGRADPGEVVTLLRPGPVVGAVVAGPGGVAYEAGPTGFGLYRALSAAGCAA